MKENGVQSCIAKKADYNWPDMVFYHHPMPSLAYKIGTGRVVSLDVEGELDKCLQIGGSRMGNLPSVYHGIVQKSKLDEIYERCGTYFPGPCPDMVNAIALCLILDNHVVIDEPIIINGHSYKSAGGKGARHEHKGELKEMSFLPADVEATWDEKVPKIWTAQTIYAESVIKTLEAFGESRHKEKFNYNYMYAAFLCFNHSYARMLDNYINSPLQICFVTKYVLKIVLKRAIMYVRNYLSTRTNISIRKTHRGGY